MRSHSDIGKSNAESLRVSYSGEIDRVQTDPAVLDVAAPVPVVTVTEPTVTGPVKVATIW